MSERGPQSRALCAAAVAYDGTALRFCPGADARAVRRRGGAHAACPAIHPRPDPVLCAAAVQAEPGALADVRAQSTTLCAIAVSARACALADVRAQSFALCLIAVRRWSHALVHVDKSCVSLEHWGRLCEVALAEHGGEDALVDGLTTSDLVHLVLGARTAADGCGGRGRG